MRPPPGADRARKPSVIAFAVSSEPLPTPHDREGGSVLPTADSRASPMPSRSPTSFDRPFRGELVRFCRPEVLQQLRDQRPEQHDHRKRLDPADQPVRPQDRHAALRHQHRLAECVLGAVAQHQREHRRRERVIELLEQVADHAASAIITALSPDTRMLTSAISPRDTQNAGLLRSTNTGESAPRSFRADTQSDQSRPARP